MVKFCTENQVQEKYSELSQRFAAPKATGQYSALENVAVAPPASAVGDHSPHASSPPPPKAAAGSDKPVDALASMGGFLNFNFREELQGEYTLRS